MRGLIKCIIGGVVVGASVYATILIIKRHKNKEPIMTMDDVEKLMAEKRMADAAKVPDEAPVESFEGYDKNDNVDESEGKMRKGTDPNSQDALEQYINLKISDYINEEQELLVELAKYEFKPHTVGDKIIVEAICDEKEQFFGPYSKHITYVTWTDLITHYIDKIHYHLGDEHNRLAAYIFNQLDLSMALNEYEIQEILEEVASHEYINKDTGLFGLFGIDNDGITRMDSQVQFTIEKKYTFEMEFNSFLSMSLDDSEGAE